MTSNKRSHIDIDPDYEDISDHQAKRQRVLEQDAKEATVKKIESIVKAQFEAEVRQKEIEINVVDQRLNKARLMMDRLRACVVACQYSSTIPGIRDRSQTPSIHPTVKKNLGKAPVTVVIEESSSLSRADAYLVTDRKDDLDSVAMETKVASVCTPVAVASPEKISDTRGSRFKMKRKIIVGNVSKFIPVERREVNDQSTHKWMLYVRGPKENSDIGSFVKKVWFFLHPSYKPNDLVEITQAPFHLTRRGWGEFPVRVQLHFRDQRNKRVDIIHNLKLDKTCTGLQTLGAETVVEVELEKDVPRSSSPLPSLEDLGNKSVAILPSAKGDNTVETATVENVSNHVCIAHDTEKSEPMEVDKESVENSSRTSEIETHSSKVNKSVVNGDLVGNSSSPEKVISKEAPKVIHLKSQEVVDLSPSKPGTAAGAVASPVVNQSGVMYMRCKDQQGNLILLPYKLNPSPASSIKPDGSKTVNQDVSNVSTSVESNVSLGDSVVKPTTSEVKDTSALNKLVIPIPSPTSTPVKSIQSSVKPSVPANTAGSKSTNLVLRVTPTGLKLVPADSDSVSGSSAAPKLPVSAESTIAANRPKLKSLLNPNLPLIDPNRVPKTPTVSTLSANTKTVVQAAEPVNKLLNNSVSNPKHIPPGSSANPNLVLANIGDKQYLLKVVQKDDNKVLLVPNKTTCTLNQTVLKQSVGASANLLQSGPPQKSLLSTRSDGPLISQAPSEQKSLTLSFGLSPLSSQTATGGQSLLSGKSVNLTQQNLAQKAGFNHTGVYSEKKIHNWKKKVKDLLEHEEEAQEIKPLHIADYPDMLSVVRAAVRRHPVVQVVVDRSQHPYCARSTEEWLSWNIGKRRASEWQRAVAVKNFIKSHVQESSFKVEQMWTTRQIMSWCRLHAFSPHHLESAGPPTDQTSSANKTVSDKHTPSTCVTHVSSLSDLHTLQTRVESLLTEVGSSDDSDDDIDIVSVERPKVKVKMEPVDTDQGHGEVLPPGEEAIFVQDLAQQIGVKFSPVTIQPGVQSSAAEDMIYTVMLRLADDILRESYSVSTQHSKSISKEILTEDVFKAVSNMAVTDVLTNSHLGIQSNHMLGGHGDIVPGNHDNMASSSGVR